MKRTEHSDHHRIFDDPKMEQAYYQRHEKRAKVLSQKIVNRFTEFGFKKGKILDDGCGFGGYCIELAKAFPEAELVGIDLSDSMLKIGTKLAEDAKVQDRVKFLKMDVENLTFDDKSFDAAINFNMFHHVKNHMSMINEIERVLTPRGILILNDIRRNWLGYFIKPYSAAFTDNEAQEELRKSNLRQWTFSHGFLWWGINAGGPGLLGNK